MISVKKDIAGELGIHPEFKDISFTELKDHYMRRPQWVPVRHFLNYKNETLSFETWAALCYKISEIRETEGMSAISMNDHFFEIITKEFDL